MDDEILWPEPDAALKTYVRQHIDETRHPESLKGLWWSEPARDLDFQIIYKFDVKPKRDRYREMIRCVLCGTEYWKGYVIWFADQKLRLIGGHCGHNHFEDEKAFSREETRYKEERRIEERRSTILAIRDLIRPALDDIDEFTSSSAFSTYERTMRLLKTGWAEVCAQVEAVANTQDRILHDFNRDQSDVARLVRSETRAGPREPTRIGELAGAPAFYRPHLSPRDLLMKAQRKLADLEMRPEQLDPWLASYEEQGKVIDTVRTACRHVDEARAKVTGLPAFFNPRNLANLCRYLLGVSAVKRRYETADGALRCDDGSGFKIAISLRGAYALPALNNIDALRTLLPRRGNR